MVENTVPVLDRWGGRELNRCLCIPPNPRPKKLRFWFQSYAPIPSSPLKNSVMVRFQVVVQYSICYYANEFYPSVAFDAPQESDTHLCWSWNSLRQLIHTSAGPDTPQETDTPLCGSWHFPGSWCTPLLVLTLSRQLMHTSAGPNTFQAADAHLC